uniref:EARP complex and GARP complex interacting protein 1 n=2 Tax=Canis lupus familiaris TaxID=9615 RepID=A0A8P0PKE7_CANLF
MEDDAPVIYGLEFQARALTPQTAETDAIRFLVGTQSLKYDNQIHIIDFDDENNIINKNVLLHQVGEIWHISTSPADRGVLATCYNKPGQFGVPGREGTAEVHLGTVEPSPHWHPGGHGERHDHPRVGHAEHEVSDGRGLQAGPGAASRLGPSPSLRGRFRGRCIWGHLACPSWSGFGQEGTHLVPFLWPGRSQQTPGVDGVGELVVYCSVWLSLQWWHFAVRGTAGLSLPVIGERRWPGTAPRLS